jgi:hypothetical protein
VRLAIKVSLVFAPTTGLRRGFNLGFASNRPSPGGVVRFDHWGLFVLLNPGWRGRARCAIRARSTPGYLLTGLQPEEPCTGGFLRLARSGSPKPPGFGAGEANPKPTPHSVFSQAARASHLASGLNEIPFNEAR